MGVVKSFVCDVFGKPKNVRRFQILIQEVDLKGNLVSEKLDLFETADLCPKALARLTRFILRGIHPVGWVDDSTSPAEEPAETES